MYVGGHFLLLNNLQYYIKRVMFVCRLTFTIFIVEYVLIAIYLLLVNYSREFKKSINHI